MQTLTIAFSLGWIVILAYVGWLGAQQQALHRKLRSLEQASSDETSHRARAA